MEVQEIGTGAKVIRTPAKYVEIFKSLPPAKELAKELISLEVALRSESMT